MTTYYVCGTVAEVQKRQRKLKNKRPKNCKCYPHWSGNCHCGEKCWCGGKLVYVPPPGGDPKRDWYLGWPEKFGTWQCENRNKGSFWRRLFDSHEFIEYEGDSSTAA